MGSFSFVHCSDLHLDSPVKGLEAASPEVAELCREATFRAFENIVELCLRRRVDFLLVAGDVYDAADRSLRAQVRFRDGLARLAAAGIESFVVHGNHDPLDGWSAALKFPPGVHVFGPELASVPVVREDREIARVYGVSYPTREVRENLAVRFRRDAEQPEDSLAVGLLHANAGHQTGHEPYAPCTLEELAAAGMDYWALGHVHERQVLREMAPRIVYPGNPQARHPKEPGARGCVVCTAQDGMVETEFVATDVLRWEDAEVEAGAFAKGDVESVLRELSRRCDELRERAEGRAVVARLRVVGRGPIHATLARPGVLADLLDSARAAAAGTPLVWVAAIEDATRPAVDLDERRQGQDFLGDLLRLTAKMREDPGALAALCDEALAPLYASPRGRKWLPKLAEAKAGALGDGKGLGALLPELLDGAESLCVDRLAGDD